MAVTTFGTNDPMAVKLWSKKLAIEVLKESWAMQFIGPTPGSLIQIKDETSKGPGDKITYGLRMQMTQEGVLGDATAEGMEEALTIYNDSVIINQLRGLTRSAGRMTDQRIPFSVREEGLSGLKDWWTDRLDQSWLNQIAGYTAQADVRYTGLQAVSAPDAEHIIHYGANAAEDQSITTTATFTLGVIDAAVERAKTLSPGIRPVKIGGKDHYAAFLHPYQVTDMRISTTTGQWLDITKFAYMGEQRDNPIFTGALGMYNNVVLHSDHRVPLGVSSASGLGVAAVRRAIFCGAQSAMVAFGRENSPEKFTWVEELFDYKNQLGIAAGSVGDVLFCAKVPHGAKIVDFCEYHTNGETAAAIKWGFNKGIASGGAGNSSCLIAAGAVATMNRMSYAASPTNGPVTISLSDADPVRYAVLTGKAASGTFTISVVAAFCLTYRMDGPEVQ